MLAVGVLMLALVAAWDLALRLLNTGLCCIDHLYKYCSECSPLGLLKTFRLAVPLLTVTSTSCRGDRVELSFSRYYLSPNCFLNCKHLALIDLTWICNQQNRFNLLVPNPRHVRCSLFTPSHVNPKTKNLKCLHVGLGDKSVKSFNLSLWFRMI